MNRIDNCKVNSARWLSLETFVGEVWRELPNYEGLYEISNYGRVKSVRNCYSSNSTRNYSIPKKVKILKTYLDKDGYYQIRLCKEQKYYNHHIHRLVAIAFIPNPMNLPQINHKDEVKTNNYVGNLEWCTCKYNNNYGTIKQRISATHRKLAIGGNPIVVCNMKGEILSEFQSKKETARFFPIYSGTLGNIEDWIRVGDYIYFVKEKFSKQKLNKIIKTSIDKRVVQLTKEGDFIACYDDISDASNKTGFRVTPIHYCCLHRPKFKTASGYVWLFFDEYTQHQTRIKDYIKGLRKNLESKKVYQFDLKGNLITSYDSISEAYIMTGVKTGAISEVCNEIKKHFTAGGYIWSYSCDKEHIKQKIERAKKSKPKRK